MSMHSAIKKTLGYRRNVKDKKLLSDWKKRTEELCKPCWELHYCPYGPIVEDFPLLPVIREDAKEHNEYLKSCLRAGILGNGERLGNIRRKMFVREVRNFRISDYPKKIPTLLRNASCKVFGHICPAFFSAEPLTETKIRRKHSRYIPRDVMLKVVRRDGQICHECNNPVLDNEVEFDHIIPFSKGGRSTAENLRIVHSSCNLKKLASLQELLSENPIEHLWELRKAK